MKFLVKIQFLLARSYDTLCLWLTRATDDDALIHSLFKRVKYLQLHGQLKQIKVSDRKKKTTQGTCVHIKSICRNLLIKKSATCLSDHHSLFLFTGPLRIACVTKALSKQKTRSRPSSKNDAFFNLFNKGRAFTNLSTT